MNLRYLQFFAITGWGIQADLILFALPMAIIWELQFFINRRWTLEKDDFYRTADLTSLALVGVFIFLFLNRAEYHFLVTLVRWLPILFFPLVIVIAYSTTERMSLDVMFYSLRRQKQPVTQTWDLDYLLFSFCLLAMATNRQDGSFFFPFAALLIALGLYRTRSRRYQRNTWVLIITCTFLMAFMLQIGIRKSHLELQQRAKVWLNTWIQEHSNPKKTTSAIGSIGQLKVSNKILFRVQVPIGDTAPRLLQEATYNLPSGKDWAVMDASFKLVEHKDDFSWQVNETDKPLTPIQIYLEFHKKTAVVPLPTGIVDINDLPALDIRKNQYGTVQADALVPSRSFQVWQTPTENFGSKPTQTDTFVPRRFKPLLEQLELESDLDAEHPISSLAIFFKDFRYSLYQETAVQDDPIRYFLQTSKAGHCEYYASSTVLILRQLGIPARYVVGYAVNEYNSFLDMYIVRQRHAHAWAIAYVNNAWQVVDTTPGIWREAEAAQSFFAQPLLDLLANGNFAFQLWWNEQKIEDYENYLYLAGAILSLILMWRIMTGEQIIIKNETENTPIKQKVVLGADSPFYKLEQQLINNGLDRGKGELLSPWLSRIGFGHLKSLLPIHDQMRFDPNGIDHEQKLKFIKMVDHELGKIESE